MPTQRMSFAAPYQAETPIGQALLNISKAFFGGPGPAQQEAARAAAERARLAGEVDARKLEGQDKLGGIIETATGFSKYAPGRPRDPNDPHWDTNAGSAADFYRRYPGELAAAALRYGVPVSEASTARVLATSSPDYNDAARSDAAVGAGKVLSPYNAFSEKGQFAAEGRETASKTRVATSAAAAANPDKYYKVKLAQGIIGSDVTGPDARRFAQIDPAITPEIQNRRARARLSGLTETEQLQLDEAERSRDMYVRQSPNPRGAGEQWAAQNPIQAKVFSALTAKSMSYQSRPPVNGVQMIGNQPYVPANGGGLVKAYRGDDGSWYKDDIDPRDGKIKPHRLDNRDY